MKKTATGKSFSHNPSYPFLNVYKEKEAVVMGLVPTGKYHQVLYNHIKKSSTNQNASSGNLVSLKEMQLDKNKLKRNEVLEILNQLLTVRLISHVVAFEYDPYQRKIRCKSHFITHPPSEKPDSLISVFEEMIDASVSAFETWIELRDSIKIEGFKKILEKQLHGGEDYSEQIGSLIDIDKEIRTKNYELQASDEMMDYVAQEVRSRLIKRKIAIPLSPKYILMLKESETLEHFEAASNILETRILPSLKTDPGFKQKVDKIVLEELTYNVEKFSVKTASFTAKKAKEARVYRGGNSEIDYPGSLSIETIINLETSAEKLYQTTWKEECTKRINEFKRPLQAPSSCSDSLITFIKQEDIANFPKEVWAALVNDNELYYSKWQSPTSTVHVFISKNPKVFKLLINEMQRLPIDQLWKSLALKNLIEENEHELKPLFQDRIFLLNYGRLLKQVYIQFMPWYYKFLFFLVSFSFFQDHFFKKAKERIRIYQEILQKENERRYKEQLGKQENEKLEKVNGIIHEKMSHSISEILDRIYFQEDTIPDLKMMNKYFPDMDENQFREYLKKSSYRIIEMNSKKHGKIELVLYPTTGDWPGKKVRLMRIFDKHSEVLNKEFSTDEERLKLAKVNKLKNQMDVNPERQVRKKTAGTDPYIRLDRRIKKMDEIEKIKKQAGEGE